jgi:hypothetical protein
VLVVEMAVVRALFKQPSLDVAEQVLVLVKDYA